jgi:thiosulfate/3-mercaptopyruvate sulfurtransferase
MTQAVTPLVSAAWLQDRLNDPNVRIVDVRWYLTEPQRGRQEYAESHIPNAIFVDLDTELAAPRGSGPGRHPLPNVDQFQALLENSGISNDTHVIAYDSSGGAAAARLWWILRYVGHNKISLLDGGWQAWQAAGYPTTDEVLQPAASSYTLHIKPAMVIDADTVEQLRNQEGTLLIDARATERYEGRVEPMDAKAGHIPGARSAPFAGNINADSSFKDAQTLRRRFEDLGLSKAKKVVCYCGSGVTAAHNIFALHLTGYNDALLYEGSWSDWSSDPDRPVATGSEPNGEA